MLHDPLEGTTPSQRLAAAHHQERIERIRCAGRPEAAPQNLPVISNSAMAEACEFEFPKPAFGQVETIQRAVLAFYPKVTLIDMISARRTAAVAKPRMIAVYLVKELTPRSLPDIGRRFGGRDHTTILHSVRKISAQVETDPVLAAHIEKIKSVIAEMSA